MTVIENQPILDDVGFKPPEVAHLADKASVARCYVTGEKIRALCGEEFVPTRDPSLFPVCESCKQAYQNWKSGQNGLN